METSREQSSSIKPQELPQNYEALTIKLILENKKLRSLREDVIKQDLSIQLYNSKIKLKEMRKGEQEAPIEEIKEEF